MDQFTRGILQHYSSCLEKHDRSQQEGLSTSETPKYVLGARIGGCIHYSPWSRTDAISQLREFANKVKGVHSKLLHVIADKTGLEKVIECL